MRGLGAEVALDVRLRAFAQRLAPAFQSAHEAVRAGQVGSDVLDLLNAGRLVLQPSTQTPHPTDEAAITAPGADNPMPLAQVTQRHSGGAGDGARAGPSADAAHPLGPRAALQTDGTGGGPPVHAAAIATSDAD